jgi:spore coat protein U domain-containing protein, fimbrial subunit CupE1/2/3/6
MATSSRRAFRAIGFAAVSLAVSGAAQAATATADLTVQATVNATCTISTTALNFGTYDPVTANAATAKTGTGTVAVACTKGSAPTIGLGNGGNWTGATRQMANGAERLSYSLYLPPDNLAGTACGALTVLWEGATVLTPTAPANKNARSYNVCGSVPAGQDVAVGSYSDTVVATVNF